jgi:hypothetical protein
VAVFGDGAGSKVPECTVVAMRAGRVKVRVHHDGDRYHLDRAAVSPQPASCPDCRHLASPRVPPPLQSSLGGHRAASTPLEPSAADRPSGQGDGGTGTGYQPPGDISSDDEAPLQNLARAATI